MSAGRVKIQYRMECTVSKWVDLDDPDAEYDGFPAAGSEDAQMAWIESEPDHMAFDLGFNFDIEDADSGTVSWVRIVKHPEHLPSAPAVSS